MSDTKESIRQGNTVLGIEIGSTRIKAVLVDERHVPIASGSYGWENRYEEGVWTYHLEDVWTGLQASYREMAAQVQEKYGLTLTKIGAMGFSAMMHGYLPFDGEGRQLVPFRTWRNTMTSQAAEELTKQFGFNIPQRWSIAHLYQAVLKGEEHVWQIDFLTTLAGYVHWKLTGRKVLGIGEASGMFPIDSHSLGYHQEMMNKFNHLVEQRGIQWKVQDILPQVLPAGQEGGILTNEGAALIDPTGSLEGGALLAPPEGDAGTGMTATNSVAPRTGNVSAGTSIFAMAVLEEELQKVHPEIDMVTTPTGKPVAMVHCNNCTNEINAWAGIFGELVPEQNTDALYTRMFQAADKGDKDCGGLVVYNYLSGEPVTGMEQGRPLMYRFPDSPFTFSNFMRAQLYSACATLKIGMDILFREEGIALDYLLGHGGFFKTPLVGQKIMAAAMNTPIAVMETAGEGGAWGAALLAAYVCHKSPGETLEQYLENKVFAGNKGTTLNPDPEDVAGFEVFMENYRAGLSVEKIAGDETAKRA